MARPLLSVSVRPDRNTHLENDGHERVDTPHASTPNAPGSDDASLVSRALRCSYGLVARLTLLRLGPALTARAVSAASASPVWAANPSRS